MGEISDFLLVNKKYIEGSFRNALIEKYRKLMFTNDKYKKYYEKLFDDVKDESIYDFTDIRTCIQSELNNISDENSPVTESNENDTKGYHECKVLENGTKKYYNEKGELHRTDGPAVVRADGGKSWYLNGKLHRTDGPAIEWADGDTTESVVLEWRTSSYRRPGY
jgi:hypothetical protein